MKIKPFEEVQLKTIDNVKIKANYFKNDKEEVVLVLPGWCMTKDSNAFLKISEAFSNDFDVLCIDFRGHGKSGGFYTFTALEENDLCSLISFAKEKNYKKIHLAGFSLGGMIALNYSYNHDSIDKIIAVSAPCDFSKIENKMYKKEAWGETFKKFELKRFLSIRPSIIPYKKIKPIDIIDKIKQPTLFIAGKLDPTVCYWHSEKLYQKAVCEKKFELFEQGIHAEDIFLHFEDKFKEICLEWLK